MDSSEAINVFEVVLRDLIRTVLGDGWKQVRGIHLDDLQVKQATEARRRPGVVVSTDLLEFSEFHDLRKVIESDWELFKPALGNRHKKYFDADFSRMEGFRNPSAHSRRLSDYEEHHVLGITGEYRNLIAIYRSSQDRSDMYYPVIEEVRDSFGQVWTPAGPHVTSKARVRVGNSVHFTCTARDPQDRPVMWSLWSPHLGVRLVETSWSTEPGSITWEVKPDHVRQWHQLHVALIGSGQYHREGTLDAYAVFDYPIDPPADYMA